jgi:hypothetical protein
LFDTAPLRQIFFELFIFVFRPLNGKQKKDLSALCVSAVKRKSGEPKAKKEEVGWP